MKTILRCLTLLSLWAVCGALAAPDVAAPMDAAFENADLKSVMDFFRTGKEINILLRGVATNAADITVIVKKAPVADVLRYVARCVGARCEFKPYGVIFTAGTPPTARPASGALAARLRKRIDISFTDADVFDVVQWLLQGNDINMVCVRPAAWRERKLTLAVPNVTIKDALGYVTEFTGVSIVIDANTVIVGDKLAKK
jgi:hypothetical protein